MFDDLRRDVCEANLALHQAGLVILTWGNVSGIDRERGVVAIKPSGVRYDEMTPECMVVVDMKGQVVEGDLRPSSDTVTHLELYRHFEGVGGVAHTHSTHATAWAQARRPLPCYGTTHADNFYGTVPVTADLTPKALAEDYELETGRSIVTIFRDHDPHEMPAVLVASHGPFTWGSNAAEAVENSIVLEQVALVALMTETLAPEATPISGGLLDKHYLRKHGPEANYGQRRG